MTGLLSDLRFGIRQLLRNRGFALTSLLVLAVGIGANVVMFSLANTLLLRPPQGVAAPEELFQVTSRWNPQSSFELSMGYPDYLDLEKALRGEANLAAHDSTPLGVRVGSVTERTRGSVVSPNYFDVLGIQPWRGRLLGEADHEVGAAQPSVVISHGLWRRRFPEGRDAVGAQLTVNGHPFTVVGITPPGFVGAVHLQRSELWLSMSQLPIAVPTNASLLTSRRSTWMRAFGRLSEGASLEEIVARTQTVSAGLAETFPETHATRELAISPGLGFGPNDGRTARLLSAVLLGVTSLVLFIACANVANLVLARASRRQGEVAVRRALGATQSRVLRLLLSESFVLSTIAALAGVLLAFVGKDLLFLLMPTAAQESGMAIAIDHRVLLFALALAGLSALVFGTVPALATRRSGLAMQIRGSSSGRARVGLRSGLVVAQLALSVVLLMAAGLLLETMRRLQNVEPGFEKERVLVASVDPELQAYDDEKKQVFYTRLVEELEALPGVARASLAGTVPLSGSSESLGGLQIEGVDPPEGRSGWSMRVNFVAPGYFEALGIPRLEGRVFDTSDVAGSERVVVVNDEFRRRFGGAAEQGRSIRFPRRGQEPRPAQVVGVVGDVHYGSLAQQAEPVLYLPLAQNMRGQMSIVVRTISDPASSTRLVRDVVRGLDADLPVFGTAPLAQIAASSLWQERLIGTLLSLFGGLALVLAAVGLYGVVAYIVSERRREIGIRIAIGASGSEVVGQFLRSSLTLVVVALGLGLAGALAFGQALSSVLHDVRALEPAVMLAVGLLLFAVAGVATLLPARAAARVDPVDALRADG